MRVVRQRRELAFLGVVVGAVVTLAIVTATLIPLLM